MPGEKVPEYGLMPPGVTADWNRFAYRFFNEAQYCRGLENAGKALADIGDPAAPAIREDARRIEKTSPSVPWMQANARRPAEERHLGAGRSVALGLLRQRRGLHTGQRPASYVYSVEVALTISWRTRSSIRLPKTPIG